MNSDLKSSDELTMSIWDDCDGQMSSSMSLTTVGNSAPGTPITVTFGAYNIQQKFFKNQQYFNISLLFTIVSN